MRVEVRPVISGILPPLPAGSRPALMSPMLHGSGLENPPQPRSDVKFWGPILVMCRLGGNLDRAGWILPIRHDAKTSGVTTLFRSPRRGLDCPFAGEDRLRGMSNLRSLSAAILPRAMWALLL